MEESDWHNLNHLISSILFFLKITTLLIYITSLFIHTIKNHCVKCEIQWFWGESQRGSHHHYQILEHFFITSIRNLIVISSSSPFFLPTSLWQLLMYFLSMHLFWTFPLAELYNKGSFAYQHVFMVISNVAHVSTLFLLIVSFGYYSIVWRHHTLFVSWWTLGCPYFGNSE